MKKEDITPNMKLKVISLPVIENHYSNNEQQKILGNQVRVETVYRYGERPILVAYGKYGELFYLKPENLEAISELL